MNQHRGEQILDLTLLSVVLIFMAYAMVITLTIHFAPPDREYTKSPSEVRAFIADCKGQATIKELIDEYEMTCEEK